MALIRNRHVVWTSCREPHLGSSHVRPRQQTGHMIASDPIRCCRHSCKPGAVHIWVSQGLDPTYELAMTKRWVAAIGRLPPAAGAFHASPEPVNLLSGEVKSCT